MSVALSVNGVVGTTKRAAKRRPAAAKGLSPRVQMAGRAERWAHWYTGLAVSASCGLNGFQCSHGEPWSVEAVAGFGLGGLVPILVLVLAQVTAWTYRAGWKVWARIPGGVCVALLVLSVGHVAGAFEAVTGTAFWLSLLMAIGIDCGLVASEATAILVSSVE